MPSVTAKFVDDLGDTLPHDVVTRIGLPPLVIRKGVVIFDVLVEIVSHTASDLIPNYTNPIYAIDLSIGKTTGHIPITDRRSISSGFGVSNQLNNNFKTNGAFRLPVVRDLPIVDQFLTMRFFYGKASGAYTVEAHMKIFYEIVNMSRSDWFAELNR